MLIGGMTNMPTRSSLLIKGLKFYPEDEDFLYRKASILLDLLAFDEALLAVKVLLTVYPNDARGIKLHKDILSANMKYTLGISYGLDLFSRTYAPANYASMQLSRANKWGSSIVRLNYSARFSSTGIQPEVDLYPKIADGVYAYLNYGYSSSTLFPRHRMGGEIYARLPKRLEASGGIRYLYFGTGSNVLIYTGSFGWYINNLWISYRPYVTPDRSGTSFSSTILIRKYFSDGNNYLGFKGGFGFSPDETRIQSGAGLSVDGIYVLKSQHLGITWQKTFSNNFTLNAKLHVDAPGTVF